MKKTENGREDKSQGIKNEWIVVEDSIITIHKTTYTCDEKEVYEYRLCVGNKMISPMIYEDETSARAAITKLGVTKEHVAIIGVICEKLYEEFYKIEKK